MPTFVEWFERVTGVDSSVLLLQPAFEIAVCRIEDAASQNARDPITSISNCGAVFSRAATKAMLAQLGFGPAQVRIMQRLLAGSGSGWPGLIRLYVQGDPDLSARHRQYVLRQLREFRSAVATDDGSLTA